MANLAHCCLHKFNILPSQFLELSREEKAFLAASLDSAARREEEEMRKMNAKTRRSKKH